MASPSPDNNKSANLQPATTAVLEIRQQRIITQTIIRPSTTYITYATLGRTSDGPGGGMDTNDPTPAPPPPSSGGGGNGPNNDALTSEQLGAILGSVGGVLFVVLLFICFMISNQRAAVRRRENRRRNRGSWTTEE